MNIDLKDYTTLITEYAIVALKKVKKPTTYNLEDLFNEGVIVFLHARNDYNPDSEASFKTYLIRRLVGHFATLAKKTWKNRECRYVDQRTATKEDFGDPFERTHCSLILQEFTEEELNYIEALLSIAGEKKRYRRRAAREKMKIKYTREVKIRNSIHSKMEKLNIL